MSFLSAICFRDKHYQLQNFTNYCHIFCLEFHEHDQDKTEVMVTSRNLQLQPQLRILSFTTKYELFRFPADFAVGVLRVCFIVTLVLPVLGDSVIQQLWGHASILNQDSTIHYGINNSTCYHFLNKTPRSLLAIKLF